MLYEVITHRARVPPAVETETRHRERRGPRAILECDDLLPAAGQGAVRNNFV